MSKKSNDDVCDFVNAIANAKPIGTAIVFTEKGAFAVDNNYNPPRVKKLEIEEEEN